MREDGRLSEEQLVTQEGQPFAVGDLVLTKQNDRRLNVVNGTRAEVTAIDAERQALEIRLADGTERRLDTGYLERGSLAHGYALTAHAAQGATSTAPTSWAPTTLYQEWGYTALTRHRHEARFYVVSPAPSNAPSPDWNPNPTRSPKTSPPPSNAPAASRPAHDLLDRAGPNSRYAHDANAAADRADARGDALQEKLDAVRPWQRSKTRELVARPSRSSDATPAVARTARSPHAGRPARAAT